MRERKTAKYAKKNLWSSLNLSLRSLYSGLARRSPFVLHFLAKRHGYPLKAVYFQFSFSWSSACFNRSFPAQYFVNTVYHPETLFYKRFTFLLCFDAH